jgi:amidase
VGHLERLWHVGALARSVDDLTLALSILAGPDGRDPAAAPAPIGDPGSVDLAGLRVAVHTDNGIVAPTPEIAAAVNSAASIAADAGITVEESRPDGIDEGFFLTRDLFAADGGAGIGHLLQMIGTTQPSPLLGRLAAILGPAAASSAADLGSLLARCDVFRARMLGFLASYDAIICPVNANPAVPHGATFDEDKLPGFSYTMTFNLTGWPAVVVRAGTSPEGLPIGVQIVARPWREDVALALARRVERELGGWERPAL